jgi:pimeloyl-ACP methyl ester carboxylesterase
VQPGAVLTRPFDYPASGQVRTGTLYQSGLPEVSGGVARSIVVVVHGLFAHRGLREIDLFCRRLAGTFDLLAVDMRGHGKGQGVFTWGVGEHRDLADLIAFLRGLYPAVGVAGFSFGGCVAIFSAALARDRVDGARPDALCTIGTPAHLNLLRLGFNPVLLLAHLGMLLRRRRVRFVPGRPRLGWRRAVDLVAAVSPVPLLILHGTRDWLVNSDHARQLYEAAGPPRKLLMIEGGAHAEYMIAQDPELLAPLVAGFFAASLQGGSAPAAEVSLRRDRS